MVNLDIFQDILLVSIGGIFGANARFIIYEKLKEKNINLHVIVLVINTFSSFILGLFISILPKIIFFNFSSKVALFFLIGFLGSLSTFSTFLYDVFNLFVKFNFFRALKHLTISFSLGIIALALGSLLGN